MQDLSFDFKTPIFEFGGIRFSVMIYTFCNAYAPDEEEIEVVRQDAERFHVRITGLRWAGGQERMEGCVSVLAGKRDKSVRIAVEAKMGRLGENIRCVKVTIHGIAPGILVNLIDAKPRKIPEEGINLRYPEGWRDIGTPLVIMKREDGSYAYARSMDTKIREKRFVWNWVKGKLNLELIFEENASEMGTKVSVPEWEIGEGSCLAEIYEPHRKHVEHSYGLVPWEKREDVPDWAREISLIASIHCQHWTGYIFNDYEQVLENLKKICREIEGKRVLAYLPGWEGRYYWKYGNYCPDERMGGEEGFRRLCDGAKELGVHLMPMFGLNIVGSNIDNYEEWGRPSEFRGASGMQYGGSVDWDGSRHYDHGTNRNLNPAAPKWQNRLYEQITGLMDRYHFDAAFFDIAAVWMNDPNYNLYDGIRRLTARLRAHHPEMLLAGEGWYDGLAACIPLLQCGHTDGRLHWHDEAWEEMFTPYARNFGHLCLGDVSRGSTGVHEQGTNPVWRCPLRKGIIPTITITDHTLEKEMEKANLIFSDAREYAARYLAN